MFEEIEPRRIVAQTDIDIILPLELHVLLRKENCDTDDIINYRYSWFTVFLLVIRCIYFN